MPDISKCHGESCPIKETCYRYVVKSSSGWQSYSHFVYDQTLKSCEGFDPVSPVKTTKAVRKVKKRKV